MTKQETINTLKDLDEIQNKLRKISQSFKKQNLDLPILIEEESFD